MNKQTNSLIFSTESDNWSTPQDFFDKCNQEFGPFDLDVSASQSNHKCERFYTIENDGLKQEWSGRVWMNPPYGRTMKQWMKKALESANTTAQIVVCLVPARTDTAWWHDYAANGQVRFIRGRLKFGGKKNSAPFPSALIIFRKNETI